MKWDGLIGDEVAFSLKHRVLNIIILLGMAMAIINMVFDYYWGFAIVAGACFAACLALAGIYYISVVKRKFSVAMPLAIATIYVITPVIWIYNGGVLGGSSFFVLIFAPIILILFSGTKRIILLGLLVLLTLGLIVIEYYNPSLIVGYGGKLDRYADYAFSLVMAIIVNSFLYEVFIGHYNREYKLAREYAEEVEKKNREMEMIRLDRLQLVGEMAASIGHEVRNPLTVVRGFLQLMQKKEKYQEDQEFFNIILDEIDRANSIITEFLSLAKNKAVQLKRDNLNRIVTVMLPLLRADSLRLGKEFEVELGDIPDLMLDENEIRQCIFNLVRNGFEVVDAKGVVKLRTYLGSDGVVLAVQDNGRGIPAEIYGKLGTPFITTKPQGTGLGIPICYKIAERHKARIEVETSAAGTTFALKFDLPGVAGDET